MRRLCARWIPKMLSECQKAQRVELCRRFVQRFEREGEDFLTRIVAADETWIRLYEPESKEQSTMWKTPGSTSPKKGALAWYGKLTWESAHAWILIILYYLIVWGIT